MAHFGVWWAFSASALLLKATKELTFLTLAMGNGAIGQIIPSFARCKLVARPVH